MGSCPYEEEGLNSPSLAPQGEAARAKRARNRRGPCAQRKIFPQPRRQRAGWLRARPQTGRPEFAHVSRHRRSAEQRPDGCWPNASPGVGREGRGSYWVVHVVFEIGIALAR